MVVRTPSDLRAVIRERRTRLGLDQISLAKKAGTSRKWLIEVENGKTRAEIGLVFRTLKALGLSMNIGDAAEAQPIRRRPAPTVDINKIIDSLKKLR